MMTGGTPILGNLHVLWDLLKSSFKKSGGFVALNHSNVFWYLRNESLEGKQQYLKIFSQPQMEILSNMRCKTEDWTRKMVQQSVQREGSWKWSLKQWLFLVDG